MTLTPIKNIEVSAKFHPTVEDVAIIEVTGFGKPISFSFNLEWLFEMVTENIRTQAFRDIIIKLSDKKKELTKEEWEAVDLVTPIHICSELWRMFKENHPEIKYPRKPELQAKHKREETI